MAQTTNSIWGGAAKVELSVNGTDWTDISGHGNLVDAPLIERRSGERWTFDGEDPIVKVGKKNSVRIPVTIVYTEESTDAFEIVRAQYESAGGGEAHLRWSPAGGGAGDFLFTTNKGFIQAFQYPAVNSEEDGPMVLQFVVQTSGVAKSTVGTGS
jgi:hypothetical protein